MVIFHSYVSLPEGNDLTSFSRTLESWFFIREIIPFYGRKIQVSEIW